MGRVSFSLYEGLITAAKFCTQLDLSHVQVEKFSSKILAAVTTKSYPWQLEDSIGDFSLIISSITWFSHYYNSSLNKRCFMLKIGAY